MGYERKRGKLTEFNALLRGGCAECFSEIVGETAILPAIKYVITLDTDTQLPRDAARQLVGTMAHPLNRPQFDPARGIVTEGYSILQPRVGVSLPSAGRSWFVRLFAGDAGIDPYTRAVSDVYQDVFQEGSFIGKGIYDVDAFERAMAGRFPENTVLSHDLLEACHARSALVSDVEFYEEYPSRYNVDIDRRHRWIRGDWQITPWLLPRVPGAGRPAHCQSALRVVAVEDFRQPAAQSGPGRPDAFAAGQLAAPPGARRSGTVARPRDHRAPGIVVGAGRTVAQAGGTAVGDASAGSGRVGRTPARPDLSHPGVPALRRLHQSGRHRADAAAHAGDAQTTPGMANRRVMSERDRRAPDLAGFYATMWIAPVVALASGVFLAHGAAGAIAAGPADPGSLARGAVDRLVDQPADRAAGAGFDGGAIGLPAPHRAQDLAFF